MNRSRPISHQTSRLRLRELIPDDKSFIRRLVNDPGWLRFIGDRKIHTDEEAEHYIRNEPMTSYQRHGFGLLLVETRSTGEPLGICGLLKRPTLDAPDLGFAFVEEHAGRGYATESCRAVIEHAHSCRDIPRILAITNPDNAASIRVLSKLGFTDSADISDSSERPTLRFTLNLADCL